MTELLLRRNFHAAIRDRGDEIFRSGQVKLRSGDAWNVTAEVQGTRLYQVELFIEADGSTDMYCECPFFASDGPCKHLWAVVLAATKAGYLSGVQRNDIRSLVLLDDEMPLNRDFELARPVAQPWKRAIADAAATVQPYARPYYRADSWRPDRELYYIVDAPSGEGEISLPLSIEIRDPRKTGGWGQLKQYRIPRPLIRQIPDEKDQEILTILGGVPRYAYGDLEPLECAFRLAAPISRLLLPKICSTGRCRFRHDRRAMLEDFAQLQWDGEEPWEFQLAVSDMGKSWSVNGLIRRGTDEVRIEEPAVLLQDGLMIARGAISTVHFAVPYSWARTLRTKGPILVPATARSELVQELVEKVAPQHISWPEELRVAMKRAEPQPGLLLKPTRRVKGGPSVFVGQLVFSYQGKFASAESSMPGYYNAETGEYLARDFEKEQSFAASLTQLGAKRMPSSDYEPAGWQVPASKLTGIVSELVRSKWHVEIEGRRFREATDFQAELSSGVDWFEIGGVATYGGVEVPFPALLKALQRGDGVFELGDGSFGLLPEGFSEQYGRLSQLGTLEGEGLRFTRSQTGLLDVLLAERPEIGVDEAFSRARAEIQNFESIEPAQEPPGFAGTLRHYQRDGLAWMLFLQRLGLGGCLADDMGVGKTAQVLALLETRRQARSEGEAVAPSLVVVPRSLIYNWKQEAKKFAPALRILDHTGGERVRGTEHFEDYDIVLTTYGTLRRDVLELRSFRFDYVILDEAQAIKNASSESAKAARLLQANQRIAMSGTPVENHLGDLWSLFDFLNPGMLGAASATQGKSILRNPDVATRQMLARALRPYILRRTKDQVEKELPEKLEQTIYVELEPAQRKLYNELREHYRASLLGRIARHGLGRSKMQVLEALLRLRQAACHPGLLDKNRLQEPSAKLETLIPQLSEVTQEGHKALVFSQFTSFLAIAREQLDGEGLTYEYLDGKTKDRQGRVERFQSDPECKVFLISLKAGGVGLNLTAADYVFLLDPWWNPAVEMQAIDRTHRIGQTRPVFAYRLIARDTVEEKVLELQSAKRSLAEAIVNADNRLIGDLTREDLELLLS